MTSQASTPDFAYLDGLTPVEPFFKRDDLFLAAGAPGGKARTCWTIATKGDRPAGLVTASSRASPQAGIVARIAKHLGIPARLHMPLGAFTPEMDEAYRLGAEIVQHKAGYNNVIIARASADVEESGWREIPFGMECQDAIDATSRQVENLPLVKRLVIPVGSGMSLAGVLWGMWTQNKYSPVLGVVVGADPTKRLNRWAPPMWATMVTLVPAGLDYHAAAPVTELHGVKLDPIYEAKCIPFLQPDDLLWIVGIRGTKMSDGAE